MHTDPFEPHRRRLWAIAYRMLGSRADADDVVQDAWLRWQRAPHDELRSAEAWLVTTTTRLAIDRLRQRQLERDAYVGPWLPEPLVTDTAPPADRAAELASDLSVAFLVVLERLTPDERAAFLLHDVFDAGYDDIARIVGKSEVACRQIVSRARKRVRDGRPRVQVSASAQAALVQGLVHAIQAQDKAALMQLLAQDATWTSDGGGKAKAARKVLHGAELVARFAIGVFRRHLSLLTFRLVPVNGETGLAISYDNRLLSLISIRTDGQRILDVYSLLNPDKLHAVQAAVAVTAAVPGASGEV